jgi:cytoskeletal protein CcmA (bactofilin family)
MNVKCSTALSTSVLVLVLVGVAPLVAQEAGEAVTVAGNVEEDQYLVGGAVDVLGAVTGDVLAAGGRVSIDGAVSGDVMAAGGAVSVRGDVADDVRLAGGDVTLLSAVGNDAVAAGGRVLLGPAATVGGRAMFAGGSVEVRGRVEGELRAGGGRILVDAPVGGDAQLAGRRVELGPNAVIEGDLIYYSAQPAIIDDDARVMGRISQRPYPGPRPPSQAVEAVVRTLLLITLAVAGVVLYLLFPRFAVAAGNTLRSAPWASLGLGFLGFFVIPALIAVLWISMIGFLLALLVMAFYFILLVTGFLAGAFALGDGVLLRMARQEAEPSKGQRVVAFLLSLLALMLLGFVPLLGGLFLFAVLLLGLGSLHLQLYRMYPEP